MAFPSGLRLASVADPGGIPAHWGANAVASTLGSALATALAMSYGFNTALLLGAALYLAVALYTWGLIGRRYAVS
jgi:acid phosphatase family membrane protein YuiD